MSRSEIVNLTLAREAKREVAELRRIKEEESRRSRNIAASTPSTTEPTRRQLEFLEFMRLYLLENGFPATFREIGKAMGVTSPNGVACHVKALQRIGLVRSAGYGKSRGWMPTVDEGCCKCCRRPIEDANGQAKS